MSFAVLFPGQGSQEVGMGADLFDARPDLLVDAADDVLGWSLRRTCLDGPIEVLTATDRAQPAIFALSYVLWDELSKQLPASPAAGAGHSLGEYTALAAAGCFDFRQGLRLVSARGRAMAGAAAKEPSGMAAVLGVDVDAAEAICRTRRDAGGRLWVANLNAPGQIVVAGGADDIVWLTDNARDLGARRAIPLNVAGAFHSPFMEPAVPAVQEALASVEFRSPAFSVYANTTAQPFVLAEAAGTLASQVVSPVRFAESLTNMAGAGVSAFVHVGPGDVTAGMAKRTVGDATIHTVSSLADVADVAAELAGSIQ